jgi:hypothetical protein
MDDDDTDDPPLWLSPWPFREPPPMPPVDDED